MMGGQLPLWLKISATLFLAVLVPAYWRHYGPGNFLWFSDLALLITTLALWLESPLLASMMALSVVLLEVVWNLDFLAGLFTGTSLTGLSAYMFDQKISVGMRALSLFHVPLPILLLWLLHRLGYDHRALAAQTVFASLVLLSSYWLTAIPENVNWVRGFGKTPRVSLPAPLHLAILMILFPAVIYLPTHLLFSKLFVVLPQSR